ncbi:DNA mismatch repair protein msh-2 [Babesia sp. Xinjiang]|uniref:DNA mismatch repair protein msh-2 n=1 Tax=Babesia sp. Xinjiang TaxID=462227 RepID=UPI000A24F267|nr:DNA mismatch repair protein msh-2 [Babesia sp. Xinjiang]ORM42269.1 DNA mismatch repair protein msh-2 [Babesia sp. Xinjiang]
MTTRFYSRVKMASLESTTSAGNLFDNDDDNLYHDSEDEGGATAPGVSGNFTKQNVAEMDKQRNNGKPQIEDLEIWLMTNLKNIIPEDMHSMYINKNNILFSFEKDPLSSSEANMDVEWISSITNGGKRRVIDQRTGKYILSNLVRTAAEQRAGLMNYVEYVRRNIHLVPLLEELNRYAYTQKVAYKSARMQLWFLLKLAEELKLVQKTKSFTFKISIGKNVGNGQNPFVLDKHVTAKWLQNKGERPVIKADTAPYVAQNELMDSSSAQDSFFNDRIMGENSVLDTSVGDSSQPFADLRMLNMMQDSTLSHSQMLGSMELMDTSVPMADYSAETSMPDALFMDGVGNTGQAKSFKGSILGNSWQMLEQLRQRKTKPAKAKDDDIVQKVLKKIDSKRTSHEVKNATNTVTVLEAACKLYGTGPKWSNPDKNEFDAGNRRNTLVYVRPPKGLSQSSVAYEYLMQYKSVHQKLNGGIRQQHAVSYGIITVERPAAGEPLTSYSVNTQPWYNPEYSSKWRRLGSYFSKSPPWLIATYQNKASVNANNANEHANKSQRDDGHPEESLIDASNLTEATNWKESKGETPHDVVEENNMFAQENAIEGQEMTVKQKIDEIQDLGDFLVEPAVNVDSGCEDDRGLDEDTGEVVRGDSPVDGDSSARYADDIKGANLIEPSDGLEAAVINHHLGAVNGSPMTTVTDSHTHTTGKYDADEISQEPVQLVGSNTKQIKLTALFRYVYTKMKKVKSLPEYSDEMLGVKKKQGTSHTPEQDYTLAIHGPGKRRRILDDSTAETMMLNYAPINADIPPSEAASVHEDGVDEEKEEDAGLDEGKNLDKRKMQRKEKIRRMRDFVKQMFEVEAEESEDENLSDPEDIRKKLQLLKQRLQNSSDESESDSDDKYDLDEEMKNFITEVDYFNAEDEELAKQRFYADIKQQEDKELARLMPLKERSERELTRREERLKLLMKLKKAKSLRDIQDLHPSDFESSDEEDEGKTTKSKNRRRISKEELEQLLKFKTGLQQPDKNISETDELQVFIDAKLKASKKHSDDTPVVRNQVERVTNNRRETMDSMLASGINTNIFGGDREKLIGNTKFYGLQTRQKLNSTENLSGQTQKKQSAIVMKSFRLDQAIMKPLNSTNIRNVGGFKGFHNLENALKENQARNSSYASNKGDPPKDHLSITNNDASYKHTIIIAIVCRRQKSAVKELGIAICNVLDSSFHVVEFSDNEFFTVLESIILQVAPTVCTLSTTKDAVEIKRLKHILSLCNVNCLNHTIASANDAITVVEEMKIKGNLEYLLSKEEHLRNHTKLLALQLAMRALLNLFDTFDLANKAALKQKFHLNHYKVDKYLSMDRAAFASLSILPNTSNCAGETNFTSLFGILNRCRTSIGARRLRMWVSQPLTDVQEITKRHDCVEAFKASMYKTMQAECLRKVPDLDAIVMKLRAVESLGRWGSKPKTSITFEDLVHLYECIISVNRMVQFLLIPYDGKHATAIKNMFTEPLLNISSQFETYLRLVEKTVDLKEAEKRNYVINRNFDKTLVVMGNKLDEIRDNMESLRISLDDDIFYRSRKNKKGNNIKIVECSNMGFLFRVSKKDQALVQQAEGLGSSVEKVRLNKNEFLFTTPQLRQLCTKFNNAQSDYDNAQSTMVNKAFKVAATYWTLIERFANVIASLDILAGFAEVAATLNYVRAEIDAENAEINLVGARHPLVECSLTTRVFVPNDLLMKRESSLVHITTGPNMGGKSTYIRQVGVIAVMNQIGSFVPCTRARLPVFHHVLCRVGASDIQLRGVSTFLAEMVEAAAILKTANDRSLVIIDELGRGTSTHDGFGLAWAIIVDLIKNAKCFCLCATHFHEMGELAKEYPSVENKYVNAKYFEETKKMVFLYEIKNGICRDSYAVNVAEIALFPPDVIVNAQRKLEELEDVDKGVDADRLRQLINSLTFDEFRNNLPELLNDILIPT